MADYSVAMSSYSEKRGCYHIEKREEIGGKGGEEMGIEKQSQLYQAVAEDNYLKNK